MDPIERIENPLLRGGPISGGTAGYAGGIATDRECENKVAVILADALRDMAKRS